MGQLCGRSWAMIASRGGRLPATHRTVSGLALVHQRLSALYEAPAQRTRWQPCASRLQRDPDAARSPACVWGAGCREGTGAGRVAQAPAPLRLLSQLERLQYALWQHAVLPKAPYGTAVPNAPMPFEVKQCAGEVLPEEASTAAAPALTKQRRRKYQKSGRPHDWRTRPDPFEGPWEQITAWLTIPLMFTPPLACLAPKHQRCL